MNENPRSDRDWEHWPGRKTGDDGIRDRLRALFSATDDDALEARIEEKGREIEEHTDQLQATITDLERREARTAQLRSAVEEMLRRGSSELDERHAALSQLSLDLASREERIRADEREIAVRKQELGAVELRRAAVERREGLASEREAEVESIAADLDGRERAFAEQREEATGTLVPLSAVPAGLPPFDGSLLFLRSRTGYRLLDRPGAVFPVESDVEIDGSEYVVVRVGRSPLVGDRRAWTYTEFTQARPES